MAVLGWHDDNVPLRSLRWKCARCGHRDIDMVVKVEGCGAALVTAGQAELLTGIAGVSSRPVRKIVLCARRSHGKRARPLGRGSTTSSSCATNHDPRQIDKRDDGTRRPVKTQRSTAGHPVRSSFKGHAMNAEQVA
jgi:hypothetical protein